MENRYLWLQVIFDLPVSKKIQRKRATQFRNDLLDMGFKMCQFSVYMRYCNGREQSETLIKKIKSFIPPEGRVHLLLFTDRQFENIISFEGKVLVKLKNPDQLMLF